MTRPTHENPFHPIEFRQELSAFSVTVLLALHVVVVVAYAFAIGTGVAGLWWQWGMR